MAKRDPVQRRSCRKPFSICTFTLSHAGTTIQSGTSGPQKAPGRQNWTERNNKSPRSCEPLCPMTSPTSKTAKTCRKHLDILQAVVARQAAASAATKAGPLHWRPPDLRRRGGAGERLAFIVLGVVAVAALSIADSLYLHNERCFRDLYGLCGTQRSRAVLNESQRDTEPSDAQQVLLLLVRHVDLRASTRRRDSALLKLPWLRVTDP